MKKVVAATLIVTMTTMSSGCATVGLVPTPHDRSFDRQVIEDPYICEDSERINGTDSQSVALYNACLRVANGTANGTGPTEDSTAAKVGKGVLLLVGGIFVVALLVAAAGASGYSHDYTTKYKYNSDGSLKSVTGPYYNSRIHRNRDGSINRIHTEQR